MEKHQELETIRIRLRREANDKDTELMEILGISGNIIRELDLSNTLITGIGFKEVGVSLIFVRGGTGQYILAETIFLYFLSFKYFFIFKFLFVSPSRDS